MSTVVDTILVLGDDAKACYGIYTYDNIMKPDELSELLDLPMDVTLEIMSRYYGIPMEVLMRGKYVLLDKDDVKQLRSVLADDIYTGDLDELLEYIRMHI